MLAKEQLKEMRKLAENVVADEDSEPGLDSDLRPWAITVLELLDELERVRKLHTEEQRRAADRLKEALSEKA